MKKYIFLAAGLVLYTVSACTPSTPVTDNATPSIAASPTAKSSEKPPELSKESNTPAVKTDVKPIANNAVDWQDYKSSAGKFSVQMPSKPQEQAQAKSTGVEKSKPSVVVAESNNSGYFVGYGDVPNKIDNPVEIQKGLADSVKSSVANLKGEIISEKDYLLGEIPCRDFEASGKVKDTNVSMKGRFCFADSRIYQVFAVGAKDKLSTVDVDRFINSFKIEK